MSDESHTCPRRAETGRDNPDSPFVGSGTNLDTWRTGRGLVTQGSVGTSCSYCGSLNPDRFMELIREGWIVGPTDKSYKVYLGKPFTDEDKASRKAAYMARFAGLSEQAAAEMGEHYDRENTAEGGSDAKVYLQHLSPEQQDEFIELHNTRLMKIGYPGHFYVPPFFAGRPA